MTAAPVESPIRDQTAKAKTVQSLADEESLFETDWPSGQPLVECAKYWETEDRDALLPKPVWQQWPIKIRNTHEDISHGVAAKDPKKATPADFAFTRDFSADNEVLVLKGAVMWPIQLNEPKTLLGVPSVALNFKVQTSHVNGDASAALEDEETWTIGLGFSL